MDFPWKQVAHLPHTWDLLPPHTYIPNRGFLSTWTPLIPITRLMGVDNIKAGTTAEFEGMMKTLLYIGLFNVITMHVPYVSKAIQTCLDRTLGCFKAIVQWHVLFQAAMVYETFNGLGKVIAYDCAPHSYIFKPQTEDGLVPGHMSRPFLIFISCAPYATVLSILILTFSCIRWYKFQALCPLKKQEAGQDDDDPESDTPWNKFVEYSRIEALLVFPGVYAVLNFNAWVRMWQIFTSSMKQGTRPDAYVSLFRANLSLATFVQYITVYAFCKLALTEYRKTGASKESPKVPMPSPKFKILDVPVPKKRYITASIVGAVLLGMMQNGFIISELIEGYEWYRAKHVINGIEIQRSYEGWSINPMVGRCHHVVDMLATVFTCLSAVQMTLLSKVPDMEEVMPKCGIKFNAARALVMIAQIQSKVLVPLPFNADKYSQPTNKVFAYLKLDGFHTSLIHVVLTQYELLLIIILQFFLWHKQASLAKAQLYKMLEDTNDEKDAKARETSLLGESPAILEEPLLA